MNPPRLRIQHPSHFFFLFSSFRSCKKCNFVEIYFPFKLQLFCMDNVRWIYILINWQRLKGLNWYQPYIVLQSETRIPLSSQPTLMSSSHTNPSRPSLMYFSITLKSAPSVVVRTPWEMDPWCGTRYLTTLLATGYQRYEWYLAKKGSEFLFWWVGFFMKVMWTFF